VLDAWLGTKSVSDPALTNALAAAVTSTARLDEALAGRLIDPSQLAAVLEGLRLRMADAPRIVDRAEILDVARHALALHQWLVPRDLDEEGEVRRAERHLDDFARDDGTPHYCRSRRNARVIAGQRHPPADPRRFDPLVAPPSHAPGARTVDRCRRAQGRYPAGTGRLDDPLPPRRGRRGSGRASALTSSAWFEARAPVAGRRRNSHATTVVDLLAAVPLVSATTLARGLGLPVRTAIGLLESLVTAGVAVEVTHRAKRRLFGLVGLAPLAAVVRPPERPEPERGRGQPPLIVEELALQEAPLPPLTRIERQRFDYGELEAAIAHAEQATRQTRRALDALVRRTGGTTQQ
jgi:hypothetical protein